MRTIQWFIAVTFTVNGLLMLAIPEIWYHTLPGVADTGPFNPHFVRDMGAAYLVCGGAFAWLMRDPARAWPTALGAAIFQLLHGGIHVAEVLFGVHSFAHLLIDAPAVLMLPALAMWSAWPQSTGGHHA